MTLRGVAGVPALESGSLSLTEGQGGIALTRAQFDALVLGLPRHRLGDGGVTRTI